MTASARPLDRSADHAALAATMEALRRRMLALARRVLRDEHEAADVVQDAYLSAWRAFDGFAEESRISTWLHRIVVNAALMRLRTRRRSREEPFDELVDVVSSAADDDSLEGQTGRSQLRAFVRRCVASLPPGHRQVIELRDFEDKDTHETARLLRTTPNAVKVRLYRAHGALRPRLAAVLPP